MQEPQDVVSQVGHPLRRSGTQRPLESGQKEERVAREKKLLRRGLAFAIWGIMSSSERTFEQEVETDGQGSLT